MSVPMAHTNQQPVQHDQRCKANTVEFDEFVSHVRTGFPDLLLQSLCKQDPLRQWGTAAISVNFSSSKLSRTR